LSVRKEQQMYLKGKKSIVIWEMDISYRWHPFGAMQLGLKRLRVTKWLCTRHNA
jgi:hypothetical protein